MSLDKKTVIVTGAGRGFGWGIAVALARAGATVVVTDINAQDVERVVGEIADEGHAAVGLPLDVADAAAFDEVVRSAVDLPGQLHALVHCAIYMPLTPLEDLSSSEWQRQLDVGLGGMFNGTKVMLAPLRENGGGHIVGIASGSSVRGYHNEVAYCSIKHAQEGFVKAFSLEAAKYNIAVNTVGPGKPIKDTRITWSEFERLPAETRARWTDPRDLGAAFAWLLAQPPMRFTGLRFDAGPIMDTLAAEGSDFDPTVEKLTLYPDDFRVRQAWFNEYKIPD